jgi:hypothetical protein
MCATLWTWIRANVIHQDGLRIVHVKRSLDEAIASALRHPVISGYCDGTEQSMREMLARYAELAQWHVDRLGRPTFALHYERLVRDPIGVISDLARFIGLYEPSRVRMVAPIANKNRALFLYYLRRLFNRAPGKLI